MKKKGIIRTVATALIFCFMITIIIPTLYLTLIPDLREGNYILYNDRYYSYIDTNKIPPDFVLFAQESGIEGDIIGREGLGLIRKTDYENVIYNYNTLGANYVYASFKAEDIPSVKEAMNRTVSMRYLGEAVNQKNFLYDVEKVTSYLENVQNAKPTDYFSINDNITETFTVCMDCEEFAGYYLLGDILICNNAVYFRPIENMDYCYEISLSLMSTN
ncbi:MAG: hypothetical protein J6B52_01030 [Clostridia bacterium]|nr:hypothetical protein [Clostridia bacterium]